MTTTNPSSRVLNCSTPDALDGFVPAVLCEVAASGLGWYVQLDLHGEDLEGPYESEDAALAAAEEAEANDETTGNF